MKPCRALKRFFGCFMPQQEGLCTGFTTIFFTASPSVCTDFTSASLEQDAERQRAVVSCSHSLRLCFVAIREKNIEYF